MAAANDRIAVLFNENSEPGIAELIEWDFEGKLLSRTPLPGRMNCGRAYTEGGRLFGRNFEKDTNQLVLYVLDTATKQWKPTGDRHYMGERGLLLGAEGDELVFRAPSGSDLTWYRPEIR